MVRLETKKLQPLRLKTFVFLCKMVADQIQQAMRHCSIDDINSRDAAGTG